jgi:hypothetical protein
MRVWVRIGTLSLPAIPEIAQTGPPDVGVSARFRRGSGQLETLTTARTGKEA